MLRTRIRSFSCWFCPSGAESLNTYQVPGITGTQFSCPHFFGYVVQIGQSVRLENRALLVKSVFSSLMWPPYYRRSPSIIVCFLCDLWSFGCSLATSSSRKHLVSRFWLFTTYNCCLAHLTRSHAPSGASLNFAGYSFL